MTKYRKKPLEVEAIQWKGDNINEVQAFMKNMTIKASEDTLVISTLEGDMIASPGDYIIKGVKGEFYPCKPDIFLKSYEEVNVS